MAKKKLIPKFIAEAERLLAAKFMTLSNVAMLDWIQGDNLEYGYMRANDDIGADTGETLTAELKSWKEMIAEGDPYCYERWQEVRSRFVKEEVTA